MSVDFFISYTMADRRWAEWIAGALEAEGYTTVLQAWDFRPGQNFVEQMDRAMRESERTIAVLSRDYYRSAYAVPEWTHAVTRDPTGRKGVLLPVRIDNVVVEGIFRTVTWIDLVGKRADAALQALLEGVRLERMKPSRAPGFPEGERPRFPGALPPIWRIPHDRNPAFSGRDDVLADVRQTLADTTKRPAVIALTGTGGIGKTALAVEYCYSAVDDYQVVWFARAERREFLVADLASLADSLNLTEHKTDDVEGRLADVLGWFQQHDQWLILLDEADRPEAVRGILPQGGGGHVLITSRNPSWRRYATRVFDVPVLETEQSLKLLYQRTGLEADRHAHSLTSLVGNLPLALELVGAFLERQGLGYGEYLRRLQRTQGLPVSGQDEKPPDYRHTLETVWAESLRVVEGQDIAAGDLLRLCAFLAPDDLPRGVVVGGATLLPGKLREVAANPDALADLVALPRSYSLVSAHEDGISLHRLLQAALRGGMSPDAQREWASAGVRLIGFGFPTQAADMRLWRRAGRLLPHAVTVASYGEELDVENEQTIRILDRTATYLWSTKTQPKEAKSYRERALSLAEKRDPNDLPIWLLNNHALWLLERHDEAGARHYLDRAVDQEMRLHGESASLGTFLVNTGVLLRNNGSLGEARDYLRRGTAILDRHVSQPHPNVATAHSHLGQTLMGLGEYDEAARELQRAVDLYSDTLGPAAPDTITARSFLDAARSPDHVATPSIITEIVTRETIARDDGRALLHEPAYRNEAEEMLRAAIAGGDSHALFVLSQLLQKDPDRRQDAAALLDASVEAGVPEALYWRGRELIDKPGREADAERTIRRAIEAGQRYSWYDLGMLLARQPERRDEAEAAFRSALETGHEEARNDLGLLLLEWPGREPEGEAALRETGGRGHARAFHNLGHFLSDQPGREQEAIEAFRSAIAAGYRRSHVDLGVLLQVAGRSDEARAEFRAAMAAGEPQGYHNLALQLAEEGRTAEIEEIYKQAVAAGFPQYEVALGELLASLSGREGEAEQVLLAALEHGQESANVPLGNLLSAQPDREPEASTYLAAAANAGDARGWFGLANLLARFEGKEQAAEESYRQAIALGQPFAWNNLGIFLADLPGREGDAEAAFIEAVRTGHPQGWYNLAVHLRQQPGRQRDAARAQAFAEQNAGPDGLPNWKSGS